VTPDGVNFSLYAPQADGVDILLFDGPDAPAPRHTLTFSARTNRTGDYWHATVPGVSHGQVYAWRVRGPRDGHLFDGNKILLDPYGRAVTGLDIYDRTAARARGENQCRGLRSVVVDTARYDWEGDRPLGPVSARELTYEMHLAGFTKSPGSGLSDSRRGTYAGLIEKIPYLLDLGVTTVEFLPVHQFDPQDAPAGRTNVWGYSSLSFFAPHAGYSADKSPTGPVDEFRDMVKALHRAGLRVILDVVYNHTAEAGPDGPTLSWRGLANATYYMHQADGVTYADYTGCGNTINANAPAARRMIRDSLRYWVQEMHVDGFRFDLGSALARDTDGTPMARPPLLESLAVDPVLAGTRLIAEAWDAGGLYQVGSFPVPRFAQWNGPFRDDVRRFLKGDDGTIENLMARIVGSPDLFKNRVHRPSHSINYVTCHDGFSLADLVAYRDKHNWDNGEENRDGSDHNNSCNHGVEGPSDETAILSVRRRQMRNFLTLLLLSHGSPLLLMGDEVAHTKGGNNNTWCQDNALNWLDWEPDEAARDHLDFTRGLVHLAQAVPLLQDDRFWKATSHTEKGDITWHGLELNKPDWTDTSHQLAYTLGALDGGPRLHVLLNSGDAPRPFAIPPARTGGVWRLAVATAGDPGQRVFAPGKGPEVKQGSVEVPDHSLTVLWENE